MSLSIAQKLFLSFLGLTLVVLVATLGLARWSFEQGFLDYVNAREQGRLQRVAVDLERHYLVADNSWSDLTPQQFESVLLRMVPSGPPHARPGIPPRRPPAEISGDARALLGPRRQPSGTPPMGPPTALFDVNDQLIAGTTSGNPDAQLVRLPIVVRDEVVGELRTELRRRLSSPQETAFSKKQLYTSAMIGIVALAFAAGLSLLLAKALLAPVRRMIAGVAQLSSGDFSIRLNEIRADELGQLTHNIDHLANTLEENRTSRRRLFADISHELRTPVTILIGELEELKDGFREFDEEQLDSLDQEVQRLRHLIDDLYELSMSDVGALRYEFASVDLDDCLRSAVATLRQRARERNIEIVVASTAGVQVNADANRLDQLLSNLLENSLAYTDSPGRIELMLTKDGDRAVIQIEDTAPGVSDAESEHLFETLYRQDTSRNRRTGGAGLGLAICRNIVTAHNGTITATPSALGGVCIRIDLPAMRRAST